MSWKTGDYSTEIIRGQTWNVTFRITSGGLPFDLSGWQSEVHVGPVVLTSSPPAGVVIAALAGTLTVTMSATQSQSLPDGYSRLMVKMLGPSAEVEFLVHGRMLVVEP